MADVYVVDVALVPHYVIADPARYNDYVDAAESAMDVRFNLPTRRLWSQVVYDASMNQAQLAGQVNQLLGTVAMRTIIAGDLAPAPDPNRISDVIGVGNSSWAPGGGGYHEGVTTVQARVDGGSPVDWMFAVSAHGLSFSVTVRCSVGWVRRTIT